MEPMSQIEHVVVLMLENRSLDSLLGWLYEKDHPQHNIPPLAGGARAYEGLQGLALDQYANEAVVAYNLEMSLAGVLRAGDVLLGGRWAPAEVVDKGRDEQRAAVIAQLVAHSRESSDFFKGKSDDELIGMAAAVLYLLGRRASTRDQLKTMLADDHRNAVISVLTQEPAKVSMLQGQATKRIVQDATKDQAWVHLSINPIRGANALNCPNFSPGESFSEVTDQLYGKETASGVPTMKGFVKDYVHVLKHDRGATDEEVLRYADQVMRSYTPEQLPVLNGLARHYAVCDHWFSSVPSQTNTNRAFAFCGTSRGLVNNGWLEGENERAKHVEKVVGYLLGDDRFEAETIFNVLAKGNTTWKVFYRCGILQDNIAKLIDVYRGQAIGAAALPIAASWWLAGFVLAAELAAALALVAKGIGDPELTYMRSLADSSKDSAYSCRLFPENRKIPNWKDNCVKFDEFDAAARAGTLPHFTFIEPVWSISPRSTGAHASSGDFLFHLGDDYHPPSNLDAGETLVKSVYESLISNTEAWNKTLLIVTFDEPVGSFDHVAPGPAVPPWGAAAPPHPCEQDFNFDRYGARVPTLLISPLIEKGTVFRSTTTTPYDHTSLIATVLKWRGLSDTVGAFGARTSQAPTFEKVLTRTQPRDDARDVEFLAREKREIGATVKYHERFCLQAEDGSSISSFVEDYVALALLGGAIFSEDGAITEYFPRLSHDMEKKTEFYFVNPDNRADAGQVSDMASVKLVAVDHGLGSYNVLGRWNDSAYCYYSNDYIEGANDKKERWTIRKAGSDSEPIRFGDRVRLQNNYHHPHALSVEGEWLSLSGVGAKWTVMPVGLRWTAPATGYSQGEWMLFSLSAKGQPLWGLEVVEQGGYGIVNLRGVYGTGPNDVTPYTSDDETGSKPISRRSYNPGDPITSVEVKTQGDYGIVDLRFRTKAGYDSGWMTNNKASNVQVHPLAVPGAGGPCIGLVGRKWAKHGLVDLRLAYS